MKNGYCYFQSWYDNGYSMSKSSRLFSLKPMGVGSSMVESLSGYISRLATEHCTITGKMFTEVFTPYLDKHYLNEISKKGGNGFFDSAHMINGVSTAAEEFSAMLNDLTGKSNLQDLTLLRFAKIIPQRGLLRKRKAWCPVCYEEMLQSNSIVYEPLLWLIKSVSICRIHRAVLKEFCPKCFKTSLILERRSHPGFCSHCRAWLGNEKITNIDTLEYESYTKVTMVEHMLSSEGMFFRNGIMNSLKKIVIQENSNVTQIACKLNVPKTTFWGWINGKNLPSVAEAIRISNKFGINIVDFYKGNNNKGHSPVIFSKRIKKKNVKLTKLPLFEIRKLARRIVMDTRTESMHVQALADAVSCNKKTLYNYFPILCKIQAAKRKQYLKKLKCIRIGNIKTEVTAVFKRSLLNGEVPGIKKIEHDMNKPAIFRESEIKEHFNRLIAGPKPKIPPL